MGMGPGGEGGRRERKRRGERKKKKRQGDGGDGGGKRRAARQSERTGGGSCHWVCGSGCVAAGAPPRQQHGRPVAARAARRVAAAVVRRCAATTSGCTCAQRRTERGGRRGRTRAKGRGPTGAAPEIDPDRSVAAAGNFVPRAAQAAPRGGQPTPCPRVWARRPSGGSGTRGGPRAARVSSPPRPVAPIGCLRRWSTVHAGRADQGRVAARPAGDTSSATAASLGRPRLLSPDKAVAGGRQSRRGGRASGAAAASAVAGGAAARERIPEREHADGGSRAARRRLARADGGRTCVRSEGGRGRGALQRSGAPAWVQREGGATVNDGRRLRRRRRAYADRLPPPAGHP